MRDWPPPLLAPVVDALTTAFRIRQKELAAGLATSPW
jgi:hypothetical protein